MIKKPKKTDVKAVKPAMAKKPAKAAKAAKVDVSKASKNASAAPAQKTSLAVRSPEKSKRIRGSFSMPESDYALIGALKASSKKNGRSVKKNELLRAGLHALKAMTSDAMQATLSSLKPAKSARPKKA